MGDSNYHSLTPVSDGKLHFTVNTHDPRYACRYFTFDPKTSNLVCVAKMNEVVHEEMSRYIPQGKVHTPLFEYEGKVFFATHTAYYDGDLPRRDANGLSYAGGHFLAYDFKTGAFEDYGIPVAGEGIITLALDAQKGVLFGLTWPSGILVTCEIASRNLASWGPVQARGEWGEHPHEWDRICRTLAVDPNGIVYGSTMDGKIWRFDRSKHRPIEYIDGLEMSQLSFSQSTAEAQKGDFQYNWRAIVWNPSSSSFWGIQWDTGVLFEFLPDCNYLRAVAELRHELYRGMPRNPEGSQLGFVLGPKNTLFYLAHGPALDISDRASLPSNLYLLTYSIEDGHVRKHGPVLAAGNRRVFFSESIAIGQDDHIYTVAWVEVLDAERIKQIQTERRTGPAETAGATYEMALVRLPTWQRFIN